MEDTTIMHNPQDYYACLIPKPTSISETAGEFIVSANIKILVQKENDEIASIGNLLASYIRAVSDYEDSILEENGDPHQGDIHLSVIADESLGEDGYELSIRTDSVQLSANSPAGLFYGAQTLRQLLPIDSSGTLRLPALSIRDIPRFEWRGAMLDVSRHFFGVDDVKRYIDLISHYKINRLHLHLSDDQGWRIEIKSWPRLTEIGGSTQVGGGKGGYYTQEQYKEIVEYARSRYVTIVPEIDTPGHTNAALASYAELNSSEEAPALYTETQVGFSSLWINSEITYKFLDDVIRELAALTPTPYIHIGGDEARSTPEEDYEKFIKDSGNRRCSWKNCSWLERDRRSGTVAGHHCSAVGRCRLSKCQETGCKDYPFPRKQSLSRHEVRRFHPAGLGLGGFC